MLKALTYLNVFVPIVVLVTVLIAVALDTIDLGGALNYVAQIAVVAWLFVMPFSLTGAVLVARKANQRSALRVNAAVGLVWCASICFGALLHFTV